MGNIPKVDITNRIVLVGCVLAWTLASCVILGRFLNLLSFWSPYSWSSFYLSCFISSYFPMYTFTCIKLISALAHRLLPLYLSPKLNFLISRKHPVVYNILMKYWDLSRLYSPLWSVPSLDVLHFGSVACPIQPYS